jgi:hypothetical protein
MNCYRAANFADGAHNLYSRLVRMIERREKKTVEVEDIRFNFPDATLQVAERKIRRIEHLP